MLYYFIRQALVYCCRCDLDHENNRTQLPLALGYAMTIHKAQGATLDKLVLDLGCERLYKYALAYVSLSRVKSIEGLLLLPFAREIFDPKNQRLAADRVNALIKLMETI